MLIHLYTTLGCHLCEHALALLNELEESNGMTINLVQVEISDSDSLMQQYDIRIPVIKIVSNGAELGWPFDLSQLSEFLLQNRDPNQLKVSENKKANS